MSFSAGDQQPILAVNYKVGSQTFLYKTDQWFIKNYRSGDKVTIIYNPSLPQIASIYAVVGYWIRWGELLFTAGFFIVLFLAAKYITGQQDENA